MQKLTLLSVLFGTNINTNLLEMIHYWEWWQKALLDWPVNIPVNPEAMYYNIIMWQSLGQNTQQPSSPLTLEKL